MKIKIHELAAQEFDEAIEWYELQSKGLGKRFKKSVTNQLKKIKQNPDWFLIETENIYKAYIPKFPYKILYTLDKERISESQKSGLFQPAGRELKALINRKFSEKETQSLIGWLEKVANEIESHELK